MTTLQIIWFFLIGVLLIGYSVLDGFDLGVGFWHLFTPKDEHRKVMMKSIGPVWDGNEVWLLTGGGAIFAAFPPVYASVFSGFYLALMLVLLGLIFRAVSLEFRNKVDSERWKKLWDVAFCFGSILPALLFGVALGNVTKGLELDANGDYIGGFLALLNPYALTIGLTGLAMFALHGALWIVMKTEGDLQEKARGWVQKSWLAFFVLFCVSTVWTILEYQNTGIVWAVFASLLAFVSMVLSKLFSSKKDDLKAFLASAISIVAIWGGVGASIFPNMVPALEEKLSLTVYNASSSQNTLTVMLIMALLGMPFVIGYTAYIYKTFAGKVTVNNKEY